MVTYYDFIAVPPGGEWLPTDIGGNVIWLRSDFAWQDAAKTVPCTNESLIWTGEDKSGLGNDVIQATEAKRPVYLTNQLNSHPAWRLDGIDDCLRAVAFTWNLPTVVYIVFKPITQIAGETIFDGNSTNLLRLFQYVFPNYHVYAGNEDWQDGFIVIPPGVPAIVRCRLTGADGVGIRLNGGADQITGNATSNADGFILGCQGDDSNHASFDFSECFGYNIVPSIAEDVNAMAYLNERYAIY